jgi:phage/plasmid-like protein (TIGR03299 family)
MAHEISVKGGKAEMMFVRETPWHGLGTKLETPPRTAAEAIVASHLEWRVDKKPVYAFDGGAFCIIPGYYATVRVDDWGTDDCEPFGLVGEDYRVLQNCDAFNFFDPVIETGKVSYETAGALEGGRRVWVLAKLKEDLEIKGKERISRYLLLSNGHDGRTALQIRFTPVRVVCMNTLSLALAIGKDLFKTHHGRGMERRVEKAQDTVARILGAYDDLGQRFERLASVNINQERLKSYVAHVFPNPKRKPNQSERSYEQALARINERRDTSQRLFEVGKGNGEFPIKGTLWAAYNGVTEMVDHHTAYRNSFHRMESLCFGDGERIKERAFTVALDYARN